MTVTDRRAAHPSPLRAHLQEIAWHVSEGREQPVTGYFVALAVARGCAEPAATFDRLVEAVKDLTAYTASREAEGDWLVAHNLKHDEDSRYDYLVVINERIEHALDELVAA